MSPSGDSTVGTREGSVVGTRTAGPRTVDALLEVWEDPVPLLDREAGPAALWL